jgi:hypothetical protein
MYTASLQRLKRNMKLDDERRKWKMTFSCMEMQGYTPICEQKKPWQGWVC